MGERRCRGRHVSVRRASQLPCSLFAQYSTTLRYAVILTTTKKTQAGLRWLKKGRQGLGFFGRSAPADDGATEEDKVKLQMQLDIDTLVQEAAAIGIDVTESPAYDALRKSIEDSEGEATTPAAAA